MQAVNERVDFSVSHKLVHMQLFLHKPTQPESMC